MPVKTLFTLGGKDQNRIQAEMVLSLQSESRIIQGLLASEPDPELKEKLDLFGQFVGDWDILEDRFYLPNGKEAAQRGELHWGWILGGRAVQDVWMYYDEEAKRLVPAGTTVRFYNPEIDAWNSVWITPVGNVVLQFIGRKIGGEIVLEGKDTNGALLKWIFSDIKKDSFTWREKKSSDGGRTWILSEKMQIQRKAQA
jgi:hypothetical protein